MRSYCIERTSYQDTSCWYPILDVLLLHIRDVENVRQADLSACPSKWIREKQLLSNSTQSTFFTGIDFNTPQDQIGYSCEDDTQFKANVHTIGTNQLSNRTSIIDLGSTQQDAYQTKRHRCYSCPSNRKSSRIIPVINVVSSMTENKVLQNKDDSPRTQPIRDNQ